MSMSTGQAGYASHQYGSPAGGPEPRAPRKAPRAETRAIAATGRRVLVSVVDMAILGVIGGVFGGVVGAMIGVDALLTGRVALGWLAAIPAVSIVLVLAYVVMQATGGSLAQRWFDVRVVRAETGEQIGFGRALARHLIWALAGAIVVGYFSPLFDRSGRGRGWHDKVTGTVVVDVSPSRAAVRDVAFAPAGSEHDVSASAPGEPDAGWSVSEEPNTVSSDSVVARPAAPDPALWGPAPGAPAAAPQPPAPRAVPPAPGPVIPDAEQVPVDTPAPPAAGSAAVSHDSFAPPSEGEDSGDAQIPDDTIALPSRARQSPPTSAPGPDAVARDPFAPTGPPAAPQAAAAPSPAVPSPAPDPSPVPVAGENGVTGPTVAADMATVPVPPDDLIDETIVLGRRPSDHDAGRAGRAEPAAGLAEQGALAEQDTPETTVADASPAEPAAPDEPAAPEDAAPPAELLAPEPAAPSDEPAPSDDPAPPAERDVPPWASEPTEAAAAPVVPAGALLAGEGFALTIGAGGLSVVRHDPNSEVVASRGGAALELPDGVPVPLAPGDVLTIGDRSITVGGA